MSFIKKRRKGDIVLFQVELREIERVRHRRINIEEATGTSYTERNSLSFPFYTDCISIVIREKQIWTNEQSVYL